MFSEISQKVLRHWVTRVFLAAIAATFALSWGIARPSFWGDEVATISGATRSLTSLLVMLEHVDAVHGVYYLFMHFWVQMFSVSEFTLRLPSTLAIVATAFVTWIIVRPKFGERLAWWSFLLVLALPRLDWAATEARSYGFTALLGISLVGLLLKATESTQPKRDQWSWIGYTLALVVGMQVFLYLALLAGAQAVWILTKHKHQFKKWALALGIALLIDGYLIYWDILEKNQINWIHPLASAFWQVVMVDQYFERQNVLAVVWILLALACIVLVAFKRIRFSRSQGDLLSQGAMVIVLPTALVAGISLVVSPSIYDPRYFTFSAPMVAILMAVAVDRLCAVCIRTTGTKLKLFASWLALVMVLALTYQPYFLLRETTAKETNWRTLANLVSTLSHNKNVLAMSRQGKPALIYADYKALSPSVSRIRIAYPGLLSGVSEPGLSHSYLYSAGLYDHRRTLDSTLAGSIKHSVVMVVGDQKLVEETATIDARLEKNGYREWGTSRLKGNWVTVFAKSKR